MKNDFSIEHSDMYPLMAECSPLFGSLGEDAPHVRRSPALPFRMGLKLSISPFRDNADGSSSIHRQLWVNT
jgi:hypothetical protein